jgi:TP901 family phage tail tape measure protein
MASSGRAREARVDITVGRDKLDRGLRDAKKGLRGFASDAKSAVGGAGKKLADGLLGGLGALAGVGGGLGLASIVTDVVDLERGLTRFQIATDGTTAKTAALRAELGRVSHASGISRNDLLAGASAYVAITGDAEGAAGGIRLFAKVANATGASMGDIASTAAAMKQNLHIDPKDFEAGFSALAVQGKAGAIELRDLASLLSGIAPTFAQFDGGLGTSGLATMGAALQVVRQGFGSSAEAATGLQSLMVAINKNATKFQAVGVKIYDKDPATGKKRLRDFRDIVDGIAESRLARDPTLLSKAFGRDEAKRAFDQLVQNRAMFEDLIGKSRDKNAIDRDAHTYQTSIAGRLEQSWNNVKLLIAEALTPARVQAFVTALEHMVELINQIADFLGKPGHIAQATSDALSSTYTNGLIRREQSGRQWELQTGYGGQVLGPQEAAGRVDLENKAAWQSLGGRYSAQQLAAARGEARASSLWGPGFEPSAQHVYGALARQDQGAQAVAALKQNIEITLKIGQDAIAKASANAPAQRTRPGGV